MAPQFSHHWKNSIFDQLNFIFFETLIITDRHLKVPTFFTFLFNFNLMQEEPDMTPLLVLAVHLSPVASTKGQ